MKKLSKRILSSLPAIFFICLCLGAIYIQLGPIIGLNLYEYFALDGPMPADGINNAELIVDALETYKLDHGQYPVNIDVLLYDHYLDFPRPYPSETYDYEYDPFPSEDDRQEFMLFFRARRSIGGWYCYYSKDKQWLKSNFSCWSSPRPEKALSE